MLNWVEEPGLRVRYNGMPGSIPGWGNPRAFALFDVQALPGGGYRAYGSCNYIEPGGDAANNFAVSGVSPDGVNWVGEKGLRMQTQPDPYEVNSIFPIHQLLDGDGVRVLFATIRNYFSDPTNDVTDSDYPTQSGCSPDGRNFATEPGIRSASPDWLTGYYVWGDHRSMPASVVISDSGLRLYQTSRNYMYSDYEWMKSSISPDGLNWVKEPGRRTYQFTQNGVTYTSSYYGKCLKNDYGAYRMGFNGTNAAGTVSINVSAISCNGLDFCLEPGARVQLGFWTPLSGGSRAYHGGGSSITYNDFDAPHIKE